MKHNIEEDIRNCIEIANGDYSLEHLDEPMLNYYDELIAKARAWDNYVDSVRSIVSKHADEDTDIEKEVRDILCVYMEDE